MRRYLRWAVGWVVLVVAVPAAGQNPTPALPPMIVASAQGEVEAVPDRAMIVLSVETRNSSAGEAAGENAQHQTSVIAALRSLGFSSKQLATQNYSITPESRNDNATRTPRIVSYLVSNEIRVEVSDLAMIGKAVDAALSNGANRVSGVTFFESNADELYRKALISAVANAKAQAEAMAAAAGGHLGPLIDLNSGARQVPTPMYANASMGAFARAETPILPGQSSISASVSGRWTFIQDR
jgi:uncharacterized protein